MAVQQTVNRESMRLAAETAADHAKSIEKEQQALFEKIMKLKQRWHGDAADRFLLAFKRFNEEFTQVQDSLEVFHRKLVDTDLAYRQNEAEQSQAGQDLLKLISAIPAK